MTGNCSFPVTVACPWRPHRHQLVDLGLDHVVGPSLPGPDLALVGVRSEEVTARIMLHLGRFAEYLSAPYGHDRLSSLVRRDVVGWRDQLAKTLAASTVNHHLASASGFLAWVTAQTPDAPSAENPATGVGTLALPPLEPRALTPAQVRSLKSVVDRLERFHQLKGRQAEDYEASHSHGRPLRDRAIVYLLLSTGLRREELVNLDLTQLAPATPTGLRATKRARRPGCAARATPPAPCSSPPMPELPWPTTSKPSGPTTPARRRPPCSARRLLSPPDALTGGCRRGR